jgi:hypothetical protein
MSPFRLPVLALALTVLATSCAHLTIKQELGSDLDQLRGLRSELAAEWQAVDARIDAVESDLGGFSTAPIDGIAADSPALGELIAGAVDAGVASGDPMAAWTEASGRVDASLERADAGARSTVDDFMTRGAAIHTALVVGLPAAIEQALTHAGEAALTAAEIRLIGEQKLAVARNNPLMTEAELHALEADYATVETEVAGLQALARQVAEEAEGQGGRVGAAMARFETQLRTLDDGE